ncbi:MAG: AAA family ATPase [Bacteroidetes bacterium]|nr:AAA family ATPase [Bacteroidota bacterium]
MYTPYIDYNIDLERHVLGACIAYRDAFVQVQHLLSAECFINASHRMVYEAIVNAWELGYLVDNHVVTMQLTQRGIEDMDGLNPAGYVGLLVMDAPPAANMVQWCVMLRELAARRAILRIKQMQLTDGDITEAAAEMQQILTDAMSVCTVSNWQTAGAAAHELCTHIQTLLHGDEDDIISTTFYDLDQLNGGFRPGQLVVIGARPGVGKSALAGAIALRAALQGRQVGFVSMEMPARELFARMVSTHTATPYKHLDIPPMGGTGPDGQYEKVMQLVQPLATLPLHFADNANLTIHDIRARAEQLKHGNGLHLLIVDYLQLIAEHGDSKRSREQNISAISRGLKMIAMNLNIPVIALSQLNRESENRAHKRPTLADLRESGAIEQDADVVILLHRDWRSGILINEEGNSTEHEADLVIAKWRNGVCTDMKLHWDGAKMMFSGVD